MAKTQTPTATPKVLTAAQIKINIEAQKLKLKTEQEKAKALRIEKQKAINAERAESQKHNEIRKKENELKRKERAENSERKLSERLTKKAERKAALELKAEQRSEKNKIRQAERDAKRANGQFGSDAKIQSRLEKQIANLQHAIFTREGNITKINKNIDKQKNRIEHTINQLTEIKTMKSTKRVNPTERLLNRKKLFEHKIEVLQNRLAELDSKLNSTTEKTLNPKVSETRAKRKQHYIDTIKGGITTKHNWLKALDKKQLKAAALLKSKTDQLNNIQKRINAAPIA